MRERGRRALAGILPLVVIALAFWAWRPASGADHFTALSASNPTTRATAVTTLSTSLTRTQLLDALVGGRTPLVKAGIAAAIRAQGVAASDVSGLTPLLQDRDPVVRSEVVRLLSLQSASAWRALAGRATDEAEPAGIRASAAAALSGAGAQAYPTLAVLAEDLEGPGVVRVAAIRALAVHSTKGTSHVQTIAAGTTHVLAERLAAVRALQPKACVSDTALVALLSTSEARVRAEAAATLAARGNTAYRATLAGMLTDSYAMVRRAALEGLATLGGLTAHASAVMGRLLDLDMGIKALAAKHCGALGAASRTTVIPLLKGLLVSTSFRVRYEAALALRKHGDRSGLATMQADSKSTNAAQATMATLAAATVKA